MLIIKGVYLYYLSLKKLFLSSLKEFIFQTKIYNKLLDSNIPSRFFFYPNPFLLSPLFDHKNFLYKITKNDTSAFWEDVADKKEKKNLHTFLWLSLIDRKSSSEIIQKIILEWITIYGNYKKDSWSNNVINSRVISWISNSDIILNKSTPEFQKLFLKYLVKQVNFIKKNFKNISEDQKKIKISATLILSGLVFKEYYNNYNLGLKELKKIILNFFDKDGFPKSKNAENLILCLQYFILTKEWIKNAQEPIPDYLEDIIEKNITCLNSLNNPSEKLPLFNGVTDKSLKKFFEYLEKLNYKLNKNLNFVGNIQIVKNKKTSLFFETGEPPQYDYSKDYQSGPFSFEYFSEKSKIITNCGYGRKISKKMQLMSKFTSAQSTLCIDNTSVVKFKKNYFVNSINDATIKNTFKVSEITRNEDKKKIIISATHNAYLNKFGYLHKRLIEVSKKNEQIIGTDTLINKKNIQDETKFSIRFHVFPGISTIRTLSGKSILLQISKNKSWIFLSNNRNIEVEKSLFLAGNRVLKNNCIVIYGSTRNENIDIQWELKKSN